MAATGKKENWHERKKVCIDRSAAVMDTSNCAFESPILPILSYWVRRRKAND